MRDPGRGLLFVVGQLGLGGLERQLYYLLRGLKERDMETEVAVWDFSSTDYWVQAIEEMGVRVQAVEGRSPLEKLRFLRRMVRIMKPAIVHSYSFHTNLGAWYSSVGVDTMAVGAVRNTLLFSLDAAGPVRGTLCSAFPRTQVYNSYFAASQLASVSRIFRPSRVEVIPNCADLEFFRPSPFPRKAALQIVGMGRFAREKRWDVFLDALRILKEMGVPFAARIYGGGPLENSIGSWIEEKELQDSVILAGRGEPREVLEASDVLLHSADAEGTPNVVLEALACGRPVVATSAGDVERYIRDGKTGFLVKLGDSAALAKRLAQLAGNSELMENMGGAARRLAEKELSPGLFVERTLAFYQSLGVVVN